MKTLHAISNGTTSCRGARFEQAVDRYAAGHQAEIGRLLAAVNGRQETGWELTDVVNAICQGILDEGGYGESDGWSVCQDIFSVGWEVRGQ